MRKFLLLLIAVSCLMMVNPQLVSAQPTMPWFVAQHRIYEDGGDFTRVIIQLVGLTKDQIDEIRFYEPGSLTPSPLVTKDNARESCENTNYSNYYFNTGWATPDYYWNWQPVINAVGSDNWSYEYYLSWNLFNYTLTEEGTYSIEVDYGSGSGTLSQTFYFSEYYPLPIVSLVSKKERITKKSGGKINVEELADGSLVLRWNAPAVPHEDTSARVFVYLEADPDVGECYRYIAFKAPTQMGMLIMPYQAVQALTDSDYYNGYFGFGLQIRVNDNSERSYGNFERYNYP